MAAIPLATTDGKHLQSCSNAISTTRWHLRRIKGCRDVEKIWRRQRPQNAGKHTITHITHITYITDATMLRRQAARENRPCAPANWRATFDIARFTSPRRGPCEHAFPQYPLAGAQNAPFLQARNSRLCDLDEVTEIRYSMHFQYGDDEARGHVAC
ncbi:hypothetical protein N431DRAFT_457020 [Stipitochalara longipes BDJ]|nr:hypothetical protein N431DRAFT_457020 [Stipitochalara longipes BDJ]